MQAPYFYIRSLDVANREVILDEENSRHAIQVLRLTRGDTIWLTDGKGQLASAQILEDHRKHCRAQLGQSQYTERAGNSVTMAISLLKNRSRFEWLLEKLTELGITRIVPLICARTEKESVRMDRMESVLISAVLQSRQAWMPELLNPLPFSDIENWSQQTTNRFIAYCGDVPKESLGKQRVPTASNSIIAIGPEGDFTEEEYHSALSFQFKSVSLGDTRLRTETAGIVAASLLCLR